MQNVEPDQRDVKGLYVPQFESDACGTGFVANLYGQKSHALVNDALTMLANMHHRGASGFEENTGDGAGILVQLPHEFLHKEVAHHGFSLPLPGEYGAGMVFFPRSASLREACRQLLNDYVHELGFELLGYRYVPTDNSALGATARSTEPRMEQIFVRPRAAFDRKGLERQLFVLRKFAHHNIWRIFSQAIDDFYIASLSGCTMVYKGQLTATQMRDYFWDLQQPDFKSAIAVIHSRFSTNTVPKWKLAQPFRYIAHNGEINTIQGNVRWWEAREPLLQSTLFDDNELEKLKPICGRGLSDSGVFDNVLEFLHLAGRSLPHSLMMMIPEAWQHDPAMADYKRAFYEYHAMLMEPWVMSRRAFRKNGPHENSMTGRVSRSRHACGPRSSYVTENAPGARSSYGPSVAMTSIACGPLSIAPRIGSAPVKKPSPAAISSPASAPSRVTRTAPVCMAWTLSGTGPAA